VLGVNGKALLAVLPLTYQRSIHYKVVVWSMEMNKHRFSTRYYWLGYKTSI